MVGKELWILRSMSGGWGGEILLSLGFCSFFCTVIKTNTSRAIRGRKSNEGRKEGREWWKNEAETDSRPDLPSLSPEYFSWVTYWIFIQLSCIECLCCCRCQEPQIPALMELNCSGERDNKQISKLYSILESGKYYRR